MFFGQLIFRCFDNHNCGHSGNKTASNLGGEKSEAGHH
ncbi:hypothetical protein A33Q_4581 [Indibacter alkaliphilus LW1]|uniref:Uncharacterized protein n=1 Tax=Indibacter alkaliphilus (strain CCUG 57479 / KCTC 22604 / LW1) TaxID=1189612 RepID=S2DNX2_INDAL|nr:hypothetical protein A33Q_4581 [Indibacter alkaliphilus LW1]